LIKGIIENQDEISEAIRETQKISGGRENRKPLEAVFLKKM
jgi:hypothetical protein